MATGLADVELAAGAKLMARLDAFAAFTDEPGRLTRLFLSDAHRRAAQAFIAWCGEAGLNARIDAAGNVVARYEGKSAGAPALMLGSHIDTVRDAGRYDGNYGALAALAVVEALAAERERLDHAVEIVAFGDEEGVRYRTTLTGSRALAGTYSKDALNQKDSGGVLMRDALKAFGGDPEGPARSARKMSPPSSRRISNRVRSWRRKGCRSESSPPSMAQPGSKSALTAWPATPARRRWRSAAMR